MTPRTRARKGEGERLRDEILAAAERLLIKTGDQEAVSIRAIADAVGVTPPSIYLHFADKAELVFAVCQEQFQHLDAEIERAVDGIADPLAALRRRGQAYVRFGLDHPEQYRVLFMTKPAATPKTFDVERMLGSAAFSHLVEAVQRCMDAGALPDGDAFRTAVQLWVVVHGITSLLLAKPAFPWPDIDALVDEMLCIQTAGLQTALPAPKARRARR